MRVGLVLAGGGARGAYEIGVVKALHNIRFDAIAGTSIGALNAAFAATGEVGYAEVFWKRLSTFRLAKIRPLFVFAVLLAALGWNPSMDRLSLRERRWNAAVDTILYVGLLAISLVLWSAHRTQWEVIASIDLFLGTPRALYWMKEWLNWSVASQRTLEDLAKAIDFDKLVSSETKTFVTVTNRKPVYDFDEAEELEFEKALATLPGGEALGRACEESSRL